VLFNSFNFLYFFSIFYVLYWFIFKNSLKYQNILILVASYIFYASWDYRFLVLIIISTLLDFFIGLMIANSYKTNLKKLLLLISIVINLGILGVFKYYNFFVESFVDLIGYGSSSNWTLNVILPVGISFYTFQTMSYSLDIYKGDLKPSRDFVSFAAFVAFFPQLVAGPIERAKNLLPQIINKRKFNHTQSVEGLKLILWGLFKKVVIADSLALFVNPIFENFDLLNGSSLFIGIFLFSFQIYCDFSGYSDIAIGVSKLLGIELKVNFSYPYFSRNIGEFWKRWHISLSTWFRDYLYIPLGGSRGSTGRVLLNIGIIFVVSGFWHGANLTFVVWGLIHAILYIPFFLLGINRKYTSDVVANTTIFPSVREFFQISTTFFFVMIAWVFFRSDTLYLAFSYLKIMFSKSLFENPLLELSALIVSSGNRATIIVLVIFILVEWLQRKSDIPFTFKSNSTLSKFRWIIYYIVIVLIILFGGSQQDFIYFQF
jgi:alginate O-acetyltransferase complex protein AlgI